MNRADFYDAELRRHNERFRAALEIGMRDRVLDIGCGAGQSAREAAGAAIEGSVLGVDVSEDMLRIARDRSAEAGLRNVSFELGDAQVHAFEPAHFDLCISRFGTMFFADPVAAFTNIGRALRPGGRLVLMVWQRRDRNEWAVAIHDALDPGGMPPTGATSAFSLGDRADTTRILTAAGFASIDFAEVREPVFYGPDVDAAQEAMIEIFLIKDRLADMGASPDAALRRVSTLLEAHLTADGVLFDSRAWIVTARRTIEPSGPC
ncbi:class I SAM-dependent methyltransferase [Sphingomonas sp. ERG5]|uniref:class I SAM-dependent methyltransferase n=1 Tax=Sphingomonas sp. ERG5 TaxID=1381597 RepID=UPI00054C3974|nr:class I SAM-dependent methyltransferase [Sphingomonas sp. ERG5]